MVTSMSAFVMVATMSEMHWLIIIIIFKIIITESQQREALGRTRVAEQAATAAGTKKANELNINTNHQPHKISKRTETEY
jgi:hypothetical protein